MIRSRNPFIVRKTRLILPILVCSLLFSLLLSCNFVSPTQDPMLLQTQMALSVQATLLSQQASQGQEATMQAQQATLIAQAAQATVLAQQITQAAQIVAESQNATQEPVVVQVTQPVEPPVVQPATSPPVVEPTPEPPQPDASVDFEPWMPSASILLYEDMSGAENVGTYASFRYVKKTLDNMGLDYVDTGSAMGRFKTEITGGGPGGNGWDLIIISAERKSSVSGEFFDYMMTALKQGSSVILEVWYLDAIEEGRASVMLSKCGLEVHKEFFARNFNDEAMYIVNTDHQILHEPNDRLSFSNVTSFWPLGVTDLGDLMRTTGHGDAEVLVGTKGTERSSYGTLMTCMGGQLILQTFSSHQIAFEDMGLIWENYIYNALQNRFSRLE